MKTLEEIFIPKVIQAKDIQGIPPEVGHFMRDFGNMSWDEVPKATYLNHLDVYSLMEHSTLTFYIAGLLKILIDFPLDDSAWALSYFASKEEFKDFCTHLTTEQIEKISNVLEACYSAQGDVFEESEKSTVRENIKTILSNHK